MLNEKNSIQETKRTKEQLRKMVEVVGQAISKEMVRKAAFSLSTELLISTVK